MGLEMASWLFLNKEGPQGRATSLWIGPNKATFLTKVQTAGGCCGSLEEGHPHEGEGGAMVQDA